MHKVLRRLAVIPASLRKPCTIGKISTSVKVMLSARQWVDKFTHWYNSKHRHSAIRYVTPNQRHERQEHAILKQRKEVYKVAKRTNPARWSGEIRSWSRVEEVWLNPPKEIRAEEQKQALAA